MISQCSLKSVNNHNVEILKVNTRDASVIFPFWKTENKIALHLQMWS